MQFELYGFYKLLDSEKNIGCLDNMLHDTIIQFILFYRLLSCRDNFILYSLFS